MPLEDILCIEKDRTVQLDNTVRYNGLILQIPKNEYRHHYIKAEVKVHEYFDHQLSIFYGPLCIGRYEANGTLKSDGVKTINDVDKKTTEQKIKPAIINSKWVMSYYKNYFGNKAQAVI